MTATPGRFGLQPPDVDVKLLLHVATLLMFVFLVLTKL